MNDKQNNVALKMIFHMRKSIEDFSLQEQAEVVQAINSALMKRIQRDHNFKSYMPSQQANDAKIREEDKKAARDAANLANVAAKKKKIEDQKAQEEIKNNNIKEAAIETQKVIDDEKRKLEEIEKDVKSAENLTQ